VTINEFGQVAGTRMVRDHARAFVWARGRLTDLGVLPGDTDSSVVAMNDRGQIVGISWGSTQRGSGFPNHAFLWEKGHMRDLGLLPGSDENEPVGINESGQIAANTSVKDVPQRAVVWRRGHLSSLGTLGGGESWAESLNDRGQIVGTSFVGSMPDARRAFLWQPRRLRSLGTLPSATDTYAVDINERGQVVGTWQSEGNEGSFIWQNGSMRSIRGPNTGVGWEAVAINDVGQVALNGSDEWILWQSGAVKYRGTGEAMALNERGQVAIADWDNTIPRIWEKGKVTQLPLLPGDEGGAAIALNERNQVVGLSGTLDMDWSGPMLTGTWTCHVVLWTWQPQ